MVRLGSVLNSLTAPPVQALFVYNSNPAAVCPNHNEVVRGLKRPDLFTVVHEQFFTDTTDYADIVLPATTFFRAQRAADAYGHYYLQVSDQAMDPVGECRSNVEMFARSPSGWVLKTNVSARRWIHDRPRPGVAQSAAARDYRDRLEREHFIRLKFCHPEPCGDGRLARPSRAQLGANRSPLSSLAEGNFATPSGKAEFYSETLKRQGLDPGHRLHSTRRITHGSGSKLASRSTSRRKPDNHLNSSFANLPSVRVMEPWIGDLECIRPMPRSRVRDGDRVRAFNLRGEIVLKARVDAFSCSRSCCRRLDWARFSPAGAYQCTNLRKTY